MRPLLLSIAIIASGCAAAPQPALWSELQRICGRAFEGRLVEGTEPSDKSIGEQRLVMHVRSCTAEEIRIPFHVGQDRSRTWVLTRTPAGLRLKHDHRHEDGSEDRITQYGGDSAGEEGLRVDFPADSLTANLIPAAAANVWTMDIDPGRRFTYSLARPNRRFRVDFDLTRPVTPPPPPW